MTIAMKDVHLVLFALHVAAAQGTTLDPDGARTRALWDAVLPLSLPESGDPPLAETWAVLVQLAQAYAQLVDQPSRPRQPMILANEDASVCGATWH